MGPSRFEFRVFVGAHEFEGTASVHYRAGWLSGPPEGCYQEELEIDIEDISMRNGARERCIDFGSINEHFQDKIRQEIEEDFLGALKKESCPDER